MDYLNIALFIRILYLHSLIGSCIPVCYLFGGGVLGRSRGHDAELFYGRTAKPDTKTSNAQHQVI